MNNEILIITAIAAPILAVMITWLVIRSSYQSAISRLQAKLEGIEQLMTEKQRELNETSNKCRTFQDENATLKATTNATLQHLEEQKKFVEEAQKNLKDAFGALSADALKNN